MIVVIDVVMSGDNAIIIGMAVAGLPAELRRRAIIFGIAGAALLRVAFALTTVHLLAIIGLTLAGGLLLLWVCYRMWRDFADARRAGPAEASVHAPAPGKPIKTLRRALITIIVADVSMSLDNVLAVAGAAFGHEYMLIFGLALSIVLMAVAANYIARLLEKHHWIAYLGLAIVAFVALQMIWRGTGEVGNAFQQNGWWVF